MKSLAKFTTEELEPYALEWLRRKRALVPSRQKVERPCPHCGRSFGARDLRAHKPYCTEKPVPVEKPWVVVRVTHQPDFCLDVQFADGLAGRVDMTKKIHAKDAGVFAKLADPERFRKVRILHGAVTWPGGLDLAPDAMYDAIQQHKVWTI